MTARGWLAIAASLLVAGCAARPPQNLTDLRAVAPTAIELAATPFFPQEQYQCGPAALATVLAASGVAITPDELVPRVYVPARRGSLQIEMLAATRASGRLAFVIEPNARALLAELAAARPVLVLLNLGLERWPRWHYAVVIGFDPVRQHWLLRSGTRQRETLSLRRFAGAWQRAENWGVVVLNPGELPASHDAERYFAAVASFERAGNAAAAAAAYRAGIARDPAAPQLHFGLGNNLLAADDLDAAHSAFRQALALAPDQVPARNNLAEALSRQGCRDAALREIARAMQAARGGPYEAAVRTTQSEIEARAAAASCPESQQR